MKFLAVLSLLIISTSTCLADVYLDVDPDPILVDSTKQDDQEYSSIPYVVVTEVSKKSIKTEPDRNPSSELLKNKTKKEDSYNSRINVSLSNSLLTGNVYFGGRPTPAEFNSYSLDVQLLKENYGYGIQFDYIFNPGSIKILNLGINAGFKHDWSRIQLLIYGGLGLANYQERSTLQNISAYGPSVSATIAVNFFVTKSLYINGNYKYIHPIYTDDLSYWGSDPRGDVAFDLKGLGLGLGWSF